MSLQYDTATRNAILSAIVTQVGAGGTIEVRTGSAPGVGNAATGTLLSTLTSVVFGTPSAGSVTFTATSDTSAAASGTPGYCRMKTSGGTGKLEADAAVGSGSFNFSGVISLGGTVSLSSATLTAGNA